MPGFERFIGGVYPKRPEFGYANPIMKKNVRDYYNLAMGGSLVLIKEGIDTFYTSVFLDEGNYENDHRHLVTFAVRIFP